MIPIFLSELVRTIIIMTLTGGLLTLVMLAIKPILRHRLPKTAQYFFWLAVLAAFLVPVSRIAVLPGGNAPVYSIVERNIVSVAEARNNPSAPVTNFPVMESPAIPAALANPAPEPGIAAQAVNIFMMVYPFMVAIVLLFNVLGYIRFVNKLRRDYENPYPRELALLRRITKGRRTPHLIISNHAATPMLLGFFRPTIVLPNREYTDEQLYGIFIHELTHMRRFDVDIKWLSLLACALHWFNPFAWLARREIDRACELSCDEAVIRNMDAVAKQHYGETLINLACDKKIPLRIISTTMCQDKQALKERLNSIMKNKKHTKLAVLASGIIILAVVLAACTMGAGSSESVPTAYPQTIQDIADFYINILTHHDLHVGVFDPADSDNLLDIRPAHITEVRINTLEKEAEFPDLSPHPIELWRLDFSARTTDLESETLRWGTFSPDAEGWIGHHTGWNDARSVLVIALENNEPSFLAAIPWWQEEQYGLEDALHAHLVAIEATQARWQNTSFSAAGDLPIENTPHGTAIRLCETSFTDFTLLPGHTYQIALWLRMRTSPQDRGEITMLINNASPQDRPFFRSNLTLDRNRGYNYYLVMFEAHAPEPIYQIDFLFNDMRNIDAAGMAVEIISTELFSEFFTGMYASAYFFETEIDMQMYTTPLIIPYNPHFINTLSAHPGDVITFDLATDIGSAYVGLSFDRFTDPEDQLVIISNNETILVSSTEPMHIFVFVHANLDEPAETHLSGTISIERAVA